ncbi:MAG: hypothetical protein JSW73_02125 [Candidatus Woesearchaeota archaeon]|nr:MAG: hypothetical protein JSW73_02125 [Candidatus Woesearchaeota archaeon]
MANRALNYTPDADFKFLVEPKKHSIYSNDPVDVQRELFSIIHQKIIDNGFTATDGGTGYSRLTGCYGNYYSDNATLEVRTGKVSKKIKKEGGNLNFSFNLYLEKTKSDTIHKDLIDLVDSLIDTVENYNK